MRKTPQHEHAKFFSEFLRGTTKERSMYNIVEEILM